MFLPQGYGRGTQRTSRRGLIKSSNYGRVLLPVNLVQAQRDLEKIGQKGQQILTYAADTLPADVEQTVSELRTTNVLAQENLEKSQRTQTYLMIALVAGSAVLVLLGAKIIADARKK